MLWDLQVRLRAQWPPLGRRTPHWSSTFTGPLGLAALGLGGSSFLSFFFLGSLSAEGVLVVVCEGGASALRFLVFLGSVLGVSFEADFLGGGFLVEGWVEDAPAAVGAAAVDVVGSVVVAVG